VLALERPSLAAVSINHYWHISARFFHRPCFCGDAHQVEDMRARLSATLACIVTALACGGAPTCPSRSGTLNVMLTDSPFSDAKAVLVTFSEVTAHKSTDTESAKVPFVPAATSRTCDLKKLQGAQDILGTGPLTAGQYTQVRLGVSSATIYFDNATAVAQPACAQAITEPTGRKASVEIPSGEVKLNRQLTVPQAGAATMVLDFDGDRSIRETGNGRYTMTPVIAVLSVQQPAPQSPRAPSIFPRPPSI